MAAIWNTNKSFIIKKIELAWKNPVLISVHPLGAAVAQWVKRWPTDLADRVQSPLEAKSSQP